MSTAHLVAEMEYERGWGSRVEEYRVFKTKQDALNYIQEYDKKYNTEKSAPDWYMTNEYIGAVSLSEEQFSIIPENGLIFNRGHAFARV